MEEINFNIELWIVIKNFFPKLITELKQSEDPRHKSYITYKNAEILFVRILAVVFRLDSMRGIGETLNRKICFRNISKILELDEDLTELPHWGTINDFLERLSPDEIKKIIRKLVYRLTRMKTFENSKIRGKFWHIVVDATQICTFKERHCPHCLTREHKKDGKVISVDYYHVVLEAKLVLHGNIVVSIASEFVENDLDKDGNPILESNANKSSKEKIKQDCELKAFYRMAKKLKKDFPRLPICLGMDSLYAGEPVFNVCKENGWHYIIRFKDGSISTIAEEFHTLKDMEPEQTWSKTENGYTLTYKFVVKIPYKSHSLNVVECNQSNMEYPFVFVTDLPITRKNCEELVKKGRLRWKIENEGFNEQKNHGLGLGHLFSKNYIAMQNHYYLIQIGHMISQFLECGIKKIEALANITTKILFENIKEAFRTIMLTRADKCLVQNATQYRLREPTG